MTASLSAGLGPVPRSYLFVPATRPDRFEKALASGADAVIFDLEDAVAASEKKVARRTVGEFLRSLDRVAPKLSSRSPELWVRTNPPPLGLVDLEIVACEQLDGVCPAKTGSREELLTLDRWLEELACGAIVEPLVEDARALLDAVDIASGPRVRRLHLGEGDLAADLGLDSSDRRAALAGARHMVVLASAAAHLDSPVAPVSTDYRNPSSFEEETRYLRSLGFWSRACIHPTQVLVANEVFVVSQAEIDWADDVLGRLHDAALDGKGVAVGADGRMIDEAIARTARRLRRMAGPDRSGGDAGTDTG